MKNKILPITCLVLMSFCACATADLSEKGSKVIVAQSDDVKGCKSLGQVFGQGGGAMGSYVSNDNLMKYAINDARNKAAEGGATHLLAGVPSLGGSAGTTTTATVMGTAYQCPAAR